MFKKLRFKIEYFFSFVRHNLLYIVLGVIGGIIAFYLYPPVKALLQSPSLTTTRIGRSGLYTTKTLPDDILDLISFGLTLSQINDRPTNSPVTISYSTQNDNKEYIFNLDTNQRWHDGRKISANDINYDIAGLNTEVLSDNQIRISLDRPFSPILSLLTKPLFRQGLIGLGSYKVTNTIFQDGYIHTLSLSPTQKNKSKIIYTFYPNESDLITAYKMGKIDIIEHISSFSGLDLWPQTNITPQSLENNRYLAIFINTQKLSSKQLRQALAYATPKPPDKKDRCFGPISPLSWAYNNDIKEYNQNPIRAKELFSNNKIDHLNISLNDRRLLTTADEIKTAWESTLGIKTTITIENQIDLQNYDVILAYGSIPHDPDQYLFWHSLQTATNITKLTNSRIDKLLEDGRLATDQQERKQIYLDFQKYLLEESPAIFISYPTTYTISRIK